jgi:hypothetical protein
MYGRERREIREHREITDVTRVQDRVGLHRGDPLGRPRMRLAMRVRDDRDPRRPIGTQRKGGCGGDWVHPRRLARRLDDGDPADANSSDLLALAWGWFQAAQLRPLELSHHLRIRWHQVSHEDPRLQRACRRDRTSKPAFVLLATSVFRREPAAPCL